MASSSGASSPSAPTRGTTRRDATPSSRCPAPSTSRSATAPCAGSDRRHSDCRRSHRTGPRHARGRARAARLDLRSADRRPMSLVTYEADGRVGLVTLNRPDKLNAISAELKKTLIERFHEADGDPVTSVVVLRAEGRSFCAGYDISPNPARAARKGNALAWHASLSDDTALELTPWSMKKPVIASVQGHCLGGGC